MSHTFQYFKHFDINNMQTQLLHQLHEQPMLSVSCCIELACLLFSRSAAMLYATAFILALSPVQSIV